MRRNEENEIVAALVHIGMVTLIVFVGCCLGAGGLQLLVGPIAEHGDLRDPTAWDRFFGINLVALGVLLAFVAIRLVRRFPRSIEHPDHRSDRRQP